MSSGFRSELVHGSAVALAGRGCLILGPSGAGKSRLALTLMAHGARLIADDQTRIVAQDSALIAEPPETIAGQIEARGIGILRADFAPAPLALVVDLSQPEPDRLPPQRIWRCLDRQLPLVFGGGDAQIWMGILQYLKGGRLA